METFYATMSSFCFTLVGLWWTVVQFRFDAWMTTPRYRRMVHSIQLAFLIPGGMSLGALLSGEHQLIWRSVFSVASISGMIATGMAWSLQPGWRWQLEQGGMLLLYGLIFVVAIAPPEAALSLNLAPLQVAGLLLAVLVVLGANLAWTVMTALSE